MKWGVHANLAEWFVELSPPRISLLLLFFLLLLFVGKLFAMAFVKLAFASGDVWRLTQHKVTPGIDVAAVHVQGVMSHVRVVQERFEPSRCELVVSQRECPHSREGLFGDEHGCLIVQVSFQGEGREL